MENNFNFTLHEKGIAIQFGEEKFLISYEETELPWNEAKVWAEEREGVLPTIDQLLIIHEHREEINAKLKEAGKEIIGGWMWTRREYIPNAECAWAVTMIYGDVDWGNKRYGSYVRAVSAFPSDLK